jgi:ferredoxin
LGVDPDADEAEIVDAYRERVKEVHPDQGGSTEAFRAVKDAYERIENGYEPTDESDVESEAKTQTEADPDQTEPAGVTVEYLDYEAITDHGWTLTDDDLFEKAAGRDLDMETHGEFRVRPDESLLAAAERAGFAWPFACRGGACTNCAVAVIEGEMPSPSSHILTEELHDRGIRLSCIVTPETDTKVVYNVKHLPGIQELLLPASQFSN